MFPFLDFTSSTITNGNTYHEINNNTNPNPFIYFPNYNYDISYEKFPNGYLQEFPFLYYFDNRSQLQGVQTF